MFIFSGSLFEVKALKNFVISFSLLLCGSFLWPRLTNASKRVGFTYNAGRETVKKECSQSLKKLLSIHRQISKWEPGINTAFNTESFASLFPIEKGSLADRNPEMLKLAIELMNFKQWNNLDQDLDELSKITLDQFLSGMHAKLVNIENEMRALMRSNSTYDDFYMSQYLEKTGYWRIFGEFKSISQELTSMRFENLSKAEKKNFVNHIKNIANKVASKGAEFAIAFTKNDRILTEVVFKEQNQGPRFVQFDSNNYKEDIAHLLKEVDVIFVKRETIAEVKYTLGPISKRYGKWDNLIQQLKEYKMLVQINLESRKSTQQYETMNVKKIELYLINGIEEDAAFELEKMGIVVIGPRFKSST